MARKLKTRERTSEVLVASDPEDNRTGYTIRLFFKGKPGSSNSDLLLVESQALLGNDQPCFRVYADCELYLAGCNTFLSPNRLQLAVCLVEKHKAEIIKALTE